MKNFAIASALFVLASAPLVAEASLDEVVQRLYLDAKAVERVASVTRRDLPSALLNRILEEDLDLLRGRNEDGTFVFAHFERTEAGRVTHGTSVGDGGAEKRTDRKELRARHAFQLVIRVPNRRYLVVHNQPVYVEKVDFEYVTERGERRFETIEVDQIIRSGDDRVVDIPEIATDVVATVYARSMGRAANLELALVLAQIVDNSDSPFFGAVQSVKLLQASIERDDITSTGSLAATLAERMLQHGAAGAPAPRGASVGRTGDPGLFVELQEIEDLLTGSEIERLEGLNRLHQLIRRLRSSETARQR